MDLADASVSSEAIDSANETLEELIVRDSDVPSPRSWSHDAKIAFFPESFLYHYFALFVPRSDRHGTRRSRIDGNNTSSSHGDWIPKAKVRYAMDAAVTTVLGSIGTGRHGHLTG